jgi:manganese transport protein
VIALSGEGGTTKLLILSQVILSLQLPFAVVPLVKFTAARTKMGKFATPRVVAIIAWLVAAIIIALNGKLVCDQVIGWAATADHVAQLEDEAGTAAQFLNWYHRAGAHGWAVMLSLGALTASLATLLMWMTFRSERGPVRAAEVSADDIAGKAVALARPIRTVGVALEASPRDVPMLAEAIATARTHRARLLLMHVVEGVGGQYHGAAAGDVEYHSDDDYLRALVLRLRGELDGHVDGVEYVLGFGDVIRGIVQLSQRHNVDLLVLGGHGHRGLGDILRGTTIDGVRHAVKIPVLAVRATPSAG